MYLCIYATSIARQNLVTMACSFEMAGIIFVFM